MGIGKVCQAPSMSPLLNASLFWSALPDIGLFRYAYVRKEVALSAEIEGAQWSPPDLLMFEGGEVRGAPL